MDPDQLAYPRSLIRIHAICLQTLLQVEKLIANSMDPDVQAGLDPCWSQTHYVGFVIARLIYITYCNVGTMPDPSEAGAGDIGVIGPPGVAGGYKLLFDGGITGVGVGPKPNACNVPGDTMGLCF
jgi:hypothetical protein